MVALVALAVGAFAYFSANREPKETFCTLALPILPGTMAGTFEDHYPHGPDACDGTRVQGGTHVLGSDCKLRDSDGNVIDEVEPNFSDGTCGQSFDPYPASWPGG